MLDAGLDIYSVNFGDRDVSDVVCGQRPRCAGSTPTCCRRATRQVNATAAVVNELVRQQKAMHRRMGQMHQQMVGRGMMMRR